MRQDKVGAYSSAADRGTGVPGCVLGSTASRVIARDLELGQLEGLGIIEYYGVGCSGGLPPLVIFPSRRRMLVSYWSIVFKNSIN